MEAIGLVTLIAIILAARLGVRLLARYQQMKNEKDNPNNKDGE